MKPSTRPDPAAAPLPAAAASGARARPRQALAWAAMLLAGALGLVAGYGFGDRLAGPLLGVVTALNAAVICALLADAAWHRWPLQRRGRAREG